MAKSQGGPVMVIGTELCRQLGIDPNVVVGIDLHVRIGEIATATIHCKALGEVSVAEEIKRFKIIEVL